MRGAPLYLFVAVLASACRASDPPPVVPVPVPVESATTPPPAAKPPPPAPVAEVVTAPPPDPSPATLSLTFLKSIAAQASVGLPKQLDKETSEELVTAEPGMLVYHNRLVAKAVTQLNVTVFVEKLKPSIVRNDCNNPSVRSQLLKKGVTLRYTYVDKLDAFVAAVDVVDADCDVKSYVVP